MKRWSRKLSYSSMVQTAHSIVLWVAQNDRENPYTIQGASENKLKNSNKKRTVIARRVNFWEFIRHLFLIWIHCCFHYYKTLKAVATATAGIVVLTPPIFPKAKNITYSLSPSLLRLLAKTYKNKNHCKGQFKENWSKKKKKAVKSPAMKQQWFFTKICQ